MVQWTAYVAAEEEDRRQDRALDGEGSSRRKNMVLISDCHHEESRDTWNGGAWGKGKMAN